MMIALVSSQASLTTATDDGAAADVRPEPALKSTALGWNELVDPIDIAPKQIATPWKAARLALESEDFEQAAASLDQALAAAERGASEELVRRILAGRIALDLALGKAVSVAEVRELLSRAQSLATTTLAAYQLGRLFELQRDYKKARFYARTALTAAEASGRDEWIATTNNLVANVLIAESFFVEAISHYRVALDLFPSTSLQAAQAADNLSFTYMALGNLDQAQPLLTSALWRLRKVQGPARLSVELDAALFHVLREDPTAATRFASRALVRAGQLACDRSRANALLLMTEAAKLSANPFLLRRCLEELTNLYDEEFASALAHLDVLQVVNLKA